MDKKQFKKCFNYDFWKAFSNKNRTIPIQIPDKSDCDGFLDSVYDKIISSRYSPNIPEVELIINKGYGVARMVPVFSIEDYCVYYFCIKELESILCMNRLELHRNGNFFNLKLPILA